MEVLPTNISCPLISLISAPYFPVRLICTSQCPPHTPQIVLLASLVSLSSTSLYFLHLSSANPLLWLEAKEAATLNFPKDQRGAARCMIRGDERSVCPWVKPHILGT